MLLIDQPDMMRDHCVFERERGRTLGCVPTMGNLHEGHLSLVRRALAETDYTVVSIYVNPIQFDDPADFKKYPRTFEQDIAVLKDLGVHAVFAPDDAAFYGKNFSYRVTENRLSRAACGAQRPGHFDGVCTVVLKLFQVCVPHQAYFGMKDYQQLSIIRGMVRAFHLPVRVTACPTVREAGGLAISSRNSRLSPEDRARATGIYEGLRFLESLASANAAITWGALCAAGLERYKSAMDGAFEIEYLEAFGADDFNPLAADDVVGNIPALICVAGKMSGVRLIDNVILKGTSIKG